MTDWTEWGASASYGGLCIAMLRTSAAGTMLAWPASSCDASQPTRLRTTSHCATVEDGKYGSQEKDTSRPVRCGDLAFAPRFRAAIDAARRGASSNDPRQIHLEGGPVPSPVGALHRPVLPPRPEIRRCRGCIARTATTNSFRSGREGAPCPRFDLAPVGGRSYLSLHQRRNPAGRQRGGLA
jgi:hypothetical protein